VILESHGVLTKGENGNNGAISGRNGAAGMVRSDNVFEQQLQTVFVG
jgi:hypothetical protein